MSSPAVDDHDTPDTAGEFGNPWRATSAYVLLTLVLTLTTILPIATFWIDRPLTVGAIGPLELFQGQAVLAVFLAAWFMLQRRTDLRGFFHLPRGSWAPRVAEGVVIGVRGWLVTMLVMVVLGLVAQFAKVTPHAGFADLMVWMAQRSIVLRVALIAAAAIFEEAFFRAFLQPRIGLPLATLCFALSHVNYGSPTMGGGVFVIGWILGRAFQRSDDLMVCAVAHGTFDAIQLLVVLPLIAARIST